MEVNYWSGTIDNLLTDLGSTRQGLSSHEASQRLHLQGPNVLARKKKVPLILAFAKKFLSPLILILVFAAAITAVLGEVANFLIIVTMVVLSAVIDFYQEYQADRAVEKLTQKVALTVTVMRDQKKNEILASEIVVGDIVLLSPGHIVPADGRLVETNELIISQSALTGESFPQDKTAEAVLTPETPLADRVNSCFMGTNVVSGEGEMVVVRTGNKTHFGEIATQLLTGKPETEFSSGIRSLGFLLMRITLVLVLAIFVINAYLKHDIMESFLFALALAIGLTPELLPVIVTINLSKGAVKMSKKGVIVKSLPAIQNFGSMNVLCTDKTGTLTEDKIRLEKHEDLEGHPSEEVLLYGFLNSYFQMGLANPLEGAILAHKQLNVDAYRRVDEIPFDFERKRVSVVVAKAGQNLLVTKGALEELLEVSSLSPQSRKLLLARARKLAEEGLRVLAVARKEVPQKKSYGLEDETEMEIVGLLSFFDPPRKTAKEALEKIADLGIEVKILTGDNEIVTQKVCQELGLKVKGVLSGPALSRLGDEELFVAARDNTIFAKLDPQVKERIIHVLRKGGFVVGYLGDGINDALSLRASDIGISVDNAVDVAKESADMILLEKDLHVLIDGVYEGRRTYGNIMKYVVMGTSSNFGNMFSMTFVASLFLPFLPMLPVQILLNNLMYDISQLAIASDNVDHEYVKRPKKWDLAFIKRFTLYFGPLSSIFDVITFVALIYFFKAGKPFFQTGWFLESIVSQTLVIFSIRTVMTPFFKSKPSKILMISLLLITLFGLLMPLSPFAAWFSFVKLPITYYLFLLVSISAYLFMVEAMKKWFYGHFGI